MIHNMGNEKQYRKKREIQEVDVKSQEWGSDFVADLIKAYGFDFVTFNPGASFRGMEESIVNYMGTPKRQANLHFVFCTM